LRQPHRGGEASRIEAGLLWRDRLTLNVLILRCRPQAGLEGRTTVVRPSRLSFAEHLRTRTLVDSHANS
jgi:hypothetical protein